MIDALPDAIGLLKTFGPLIVLAGYFVYKDWTSYGKMTARLCALEDEMRSVVLPLVRECSEVIKHNTTALERLERRLDQ
jgi:hypothetical protein